jgi:hypothetical protein
LSRLVTLDAPSNPRGFDSDRVRWDIADKFLHERLPTLPPFLRSGPLDTVNQLHERHHGQTNLGFAMLVLELLQDLPNAVAPSFARDDHAGIKD